MNRSILFALPLAVFAVACAPSSSDDDAAASSADNLTGIGDLGLLEQSLGLVKDPARTRPEATVKNGPCYQKLNAGQQPWNMRRYTKGAAFFYTSATGALLDPVVCVDLDVSTAPGGPDMTLPLTSASLDMAVRFPFGALKGSYPTLGSDGAGLQVLAFANTQVAVVVTPSNLEHTFGENVPMWGDRGMIRSFTGGFVPANHEALGAGQVVPQITRILPHIANLAYRYAKDESSTSMATDPIGRFVSVEDLSVGDFDAWKYVVHFERADVTYQVFKDSTGKATENLSLGLRAPGHGFAGCYRPFDAEAHDYRCFNRVGGKPWEDVLGHD